MENITIKTANNAANVIGGLLVNLSQLQIDEEQLEKQNKELQLQIRNLRKESEHSEPRRYNPSNKQIRNKGIK